MQVQEQSEALRRLTINEVIRVQPSTVAVFRRYGMDACCGGGLAVEEAARRHGVDVEEIVAALQLEVTGTVGGGTAG